MEETPGSVELNSELFKYASKELRLILVLLALRWGSIPEVWYRVRNVFVRKCIVRTEKTMEELISQVLHANSLQNLWI
jgi:hypothetical protein